MNPAMKLLRQIMLTSLVLLAAAWASAEAAQWLLRSRAEHLLADIRSLDVNRSTWSDAQQVMKKWGRWNASAGSCTEIACDYRINIIQTLPSVLVGNPTKGANNWLPNLVDRLGLRSAAARGGFTIDHGIVITKWFGEQVTLPVRDWDQPTDYIPYLSIASDQSAKFFLHTAGRKLLHPNRVVWVYRSDMEVSFSPDEIPAEQSLLMDFRFTCITRLRPCENQGEILPEGLRMLQEQELSAPSR